MGVPTREGNILEGGNHGGSGAREGPGGDGRTDRG